MKFMLPNSDLRYLKFFRFLIIPTLLVLEIPVAPNSAAGPIRWMLCLGKPSSRLGLFSGLFGHQPLAKSNSNRNNIKNVATRNRVKNPTEATMLVPPRLARVCKWASSSNP